MRELLIEGYKIPNHPSIFVPIPARKSMSGSARKKIPTTIVEKAEDQDVEMEVGLATKIAVTFSLVQPGSYYVEK